MYAHVEAVHDDLDTLEAECADLRAQNKAMTEVLADLRRLNEAEVERLRGAAKGWHEHVAQAVASLTAADTALESITGWSGGSGNWPAQEMHPRVQAAIRLLRSKYGDDKLCDEFIAAIFKEPTP
jgi:hypothetical protein